jgi:hypothetical protein
VLVYTLKILTKLVNFRHLKIGRRSRAREREENRIYQPPTIKDKIYLLKRSELAETALPTESGWPWDDLADQGGAVVPDNGVATHEIRPETHD